MIALSEYKSQAGRPMICRTGTCQPLRSHGIALDQHMRHHVIGDHARLAVLALADIAQEQLDRRSGHGGDRLANGCIPPNGRRRRVSSKPTTDKSRGTSSPRRCATETAAAAMSSLLAKIAVGGLLRLSSFSRSLPGRSDK